MGRAAAQVEQVLELNEEIRELAEAYADARNFLYLGRGYQFPVALESAPCRSAHRGLNARKLDPSAHGHVPSKGFALVRASREIQRMVKLDMDAIRKLSVAERLALVEDIWGTISHDPEAVPVSEAQLAEARRRLAEHDADPASAIVWEEAEGRLRSRT